FAAIDEAKSPCWHAGHLVDRRLEREHGAFSDVGTEHARVAAVRARMWAATAQTGSWRRGKRVGADHNQWMLHAHEQVLLRHHEDHDRHGALIRLEQQAERVESVAADVSTDV